MARPAYASEGQQIQIEQYAAASAQRGDISTALTEEQLSCFSKEVTEGFEVDEASRSDWVDAAEKGLKLISGKAPDRVPPWPNASNVVTTISQDAVLKFASRSYPGIVQGSDVVKGKVRGRDENGEKNKRAMRVSRHMSDQLLEQSPDWESGMDMLLHQLPAIGHAFKKVTWMASEQRPDSQFRTALNVVVNQKTKSLKSCPRITEKLEPYPYEIEERMRQGIYRQVELAMDASEDSQKPQELLECHLRYDLDKDGYPEPWIVTVFKEGGVVLSVVANFEPGDVKRGQDGKVALIKARQHYVDYVFVPDPNGDYYGKGFGALLAMPQAIVDTMLNQIIDSATIQNAGGGFMGRGVQLNRPAGEVTLNPRKWITVPTSGDDLRRNIVPFAEFNRGPSAATFQLLQLAMGMAKDSSFVTDVLSGDVPRSQAMGTTLALIEQSLQVFSGIYKRIYRAEGAEFKLIYELNGKYLPIQVYQEFCDEPVQGTQDGRCVDYTEGGFDLSPIADPAQVTSMQRMAQAQFLMTFVGMPGVNAQAIYMEAWKAARIEDPQRFIDQSGPSPFEMARVKYELLQMAADVIKTRTEALKNVAQAEGEEAGSNLAEYQMIVSFYEAAAALANPGAANGQTQGQPGGMGGLVGLAGGAGLPGDLGPPGAGQPGSMAGAVMGPGGAAGNGAGGAFLPQGAGGDRVGAA